MYVSQCPNPNETTSFVICLKQYYSMRLCKCIRRSYIWKFCTR